MKHRTALSLKAVQLSNFKQNRISEFSTNELGTFRPEITPSFWTEFEHYLYHHDLELRDAFIPVRENHRYNGFGMIYF